MTRLYTDTQYRVAKTHDIKFLKLQVIFRKRAANFRALLQKIRYPVKIRHPMGLRRTLANMALTSMQHGTNIYAKTKSKEESF